MVSSGYGNLQTSAEPIRSKETSTNCLLAKHGCVGERSLRGRSNGQRDLSSHTMKDTHQMTVFSIERITQKGSCTSLYPVCSKKPPEGATIHNAVREKTKKTVMRSVLVLCCHNDAPWHGSVLISTAAIGPKRLATSSHLKRAVKRINGLSYRVHCAPHWDNSAVSPLNTLS